MPGSALMTRSVFRGAHNRAHGDRPVERGLTGCLCDVHRGCVAVRTISLKTAVYEPSGRHDRRHRLPDAERRRAPVSPVDRGRGPRHRRVTGEPRTLGGVPGAVL